MPRLTIVIPYHRSFGTVFLEETILSALENRGGDSEILVVTDGSYRDPYRLADAEVTFFSLPGKHSLVQRVNVAAEAARTVVTCVLLPGTLWGNCSFTQIFDVFENRSNAAAIPAILDRGGQNRVFSGGFACRSHGIVANHKPGRQIPTGSLLVPHANGALFRTSVLRQLGGLLPQLCLQMAYADFCFRAERLGLRCAELPSNGFFAFPSQKIFSSPFEQAKQSELFYRLWRHQGSISQNRREHFKTIVDECRRNFPGPRMFRLLAGRLAGAFSGEIPSDEIDHRRPQTFQRDESPLIPESCVAESRFALKVFDGNESEETSVRPKTKSPVATRDDDHLRAA